MPSAISIDAGPDPTRAALDDAFARETRLGVLLAAAGWTLYGLQILATQIADLATFARNMPTLYSRTNIFVLIELLIIPMGVLNYLLAARSPRPIFWTYVFMGLQALLLSELDFGWIWSMAGAENVPAVMGFRYQDLVQSAVFLSVFVLPLSSRLALTAGAVSLSIWCVGIAVGMLRLKATRFFLGGFDHPLGDKGLTDIMRPEVLIPDVGVFSVLLVAVLVGFVALACREGRRFVIAGVEAEADRNFLRRFFPPAVAERIGSSGGAALAPARRKVAVLFVDVGGDAAAGLEALQAAHARIEAEAFAHGGVLDRFSGGPAMATFGALESEPAAAAKALACARALAGAGAGSTDFRMALHAGEAVCGEVSGGQTRVFSVVGDVVNTTRRILDVVRGQGAMLVLTDTVRDLAGERRTAALADLGEVELRGREAPVRLWSLQT